MDIYDCDDADYQRIKQEYENAVDYKLLAWALPYFDGTKKPDSKDLYTICTISDKAAKEIERLTGREVYGFKQVLRCDEVVHIAKRHGKNGNADHSMEDICDLVRIKYVIDNYDAIWDTGAYVNGLYSKENRHAECLTFVKRINGYVITAQAITDSKKKGMLFIQSMYKATTKSYLQELEKWEKRVAQKTTQKKECVTDGQSLRSNVRNDRTPNTCILPHNDKNVNNFFGNSSEQKTAKKSQGNDNDGFSL